MQVPLYDEFADYDRFVNWEKRLAHELPFVEQILAGSGARRVLDVACGTGKHAIALARRGYEVVGADLSTAMIARARENAVHDLPPSGQTAQGGSVSFVVAGFGELAVQLSGSFHALLCLGNSLPHVLTADALRATLDDFASVVHPGGVLFIQNRNMDAVVAQRARWMPLQSQREGAHEWLFQRFYDFNANGSLTFNVVMLERKEGKPWTQRIRQTALYPWQRDELVDAVRDAGFEAVTCYGDMAGAPFDAENSANLVVVARRPAR